ncbi:unnamed protein product [Rhizoctonia solani]|uniref:Uncharacterized protein n=1 Tax=Rhizoctonia solani TaxID=456999 RepID=A0A8H3B8J2_9AGAM|nr:unnamed protein product [Rhizoctonia solani]CAE6524578.1 unnamed protein product [Rhizoctonia solani]
MSKMRERIPAWKRVGPCGPSVRVARRKSNLGRHVPTTDRAAGNVDIEPLMPVEHLTAAAREDLQPQAITQSAGGSLDVRPLPKVPGGTNKRQKSKGGLQGMLQRNREREAREAQDKSANSSSLSSFLQGL